VAVDARRHAHWRFLEGAEQRSDGPQPRASEDGQREQRQGSSWLMHQFFVLVQLMQLMHQATLAVDMRWLFICAAMGGTTPSQPNRFLIVRHLAQRIHQRCIPSRMFTSQRLFIGMPHPDVRRGLDPLEVLPRSRRLLLRHSRDIGMDAPIVPTRMVEVGSFVLHHTRLLADT
jgi:hypothetical protein